MPVVLDQTGPSGFAGAQAIDGINLAVEEANADKTLGDATLKLDITDPGSDPRQAANLVTAAVRDVKHTGITGRVEFDAKGDPKKALYFVLQVASDNPEKWGDKKEVKRLTIAAPAAKK